MGLPPAAATAIDDYLRAADRVVPDLVDALYAIGSIALGDYRPGVSDIDVVAVCRRPLTERQLVALEAVHRDADPSVDVLYVTSDELAADPTSLSPPYSFGGTFHREGGFQANPVVWRELATTAVPVRGPDLAADEVWFDADTLRRWNLDNLDGYWAARIADWRRIVPTDAFLRHKDGLQWFVLGPPRSHHTIRTLHVTSKTAAGRYALEIVDTRWHPVLEAAMAVRADAAAPLPKSADELRVDAIDLCTWLIADAHVQRG